MVFFVLIIHPFVRLFIGLRVRGRQHLSVSGPFILIANHSSHLDTVSLLSLFPLSHLRRIRPCAAADYFESNRFLSFFSKVFFNILPVTRMKITPENHPVRRMVEALHRGESLLLFPEGTRASGEAMAGFKAGIAHLVEEVPDIPIIPAYLVNMGRSLPKGEYLPVPFFCEVRVGAPRIISGSRKEMLSALETAVLELKESAPGP